jgi:selenide,water dikinase
MTIRSAVRLTQYAHGGGCACKIPPGELEAAVASLIPARPSADLLIGVEHGDDAAVVRISADRAVVATADFFTPVVDDAFTFGQIAAANALSDVYAVGGEPLVAVNLLGWPRDVLPIELAAEVLRGGLEIAGAANCHVAGGHSIDDPEPKYGMAVTGLADPAALLRIDAGRAGLPLSLTKPLGSGVLNSRHKATGEVFPAAIEVMTSLNARASRDALAAGIGCATDVTGFGLLGHLHELALASGLAAELVASDVPAIDGVLELLGMGGEPAVAGGTRRNREHAEQFSSFSDAVAPARRWLVCDATTSGGLLAAVPAGQVDAMPGTVVGRLVAGEPGTIRVA